MKTLRTWQLIGESLSKKTPVMLLYVLESSGSSPGRQGFFMCINARDEMEGSIGGGIMEHKFVEMAKKRLKTVGETRLTIRRQIHDKSASANQSGMICSGEQTILMYEVQTGDHTSIRKIIGSLDKNENGTLVLSPKGIDFTSSTPPKDFEFCFESAEDWIYREKTGYKNKLFIVGGGHCALALSRLMRSMDFYIRVFDERADLKTMAENDAAHEKHIVRNYAELGSAIAPGYNHYVVIMTFGYRTDDIALRALEGKEFRYLGLLGSSGKVKKMLDEYREKGINRDWLDQIHTPIGLSIKSQTPEEIAVSIAAEIIRIKNQDL
jgi:xanthine dehydrogenase accessory factor